LNKIKRILTPAAILKKIKNNIQDCQEMTEEKTQEIYQDCQTVSNLLAEIELGTDKFKYRLNKADGLKYKNTVASPFFTSVGANHNLGREMLAKNLINQSVKYPNVPLIPVLNRAHQILHKPLPSLQDFVLSGIYYLTPRSSFLANYQENPLLIQKFEGNHSVTISIFVAK